MPNVGVAIILYRALSGLGCVVGSLTQGCALGYHMAAFQAGRRVLGATGFASVLELRNACGREVELGVPVSCVTCKLALAL
jgi:hypothetical protein